jgi:hypothetical protein
LESQAERWFVATERSKGGVGVTAAMAPIE